MFDGYLQSEISRIYRYVLRNIDRVPIIDEAMQKLQTDLQNKSVAIDNLQQKNDELKEQIVEIEERYANLLALIEKINPTIFNGS